MDLMRYASWSRGNQPPTRHQDRPGRLTREGQRMARLWLVSADVRLDRGWQLVISAPATAVSTASVSATPVSAATTATAPVATTAATPFRRYRWDRSGAWSGPVTMPTRWAALMEPVTTMVEPGHANERTDAMAGTPPAVVEAIAAVVTEVVAGATAVVSAFHGHTTGQNDQGHTDHQQPREQTGERGHCGDTIFVRPSRHSSTPNGAPSGAAIRASLPP
jgi:hypothetical protein